VIKRNYLAMAGLFVALRASAVSAQPTPAEVWRTMPDPSLRRLYVMGIIDGVVLAQIQAHRFFSDTTVRRAWLKQPPDSRIPIDTVFALILKQFVTANVGAVVEVMGKLYEEPANSCLAWSTVALVSIERLNGVSLAAQEDQLAKLRQVSAASCKPR
jgi:hypothetical protein